MSPWAKRTEAYSRLNQKPFYSGYVIQVGHEMLLRKLPKDVSKRRKAENKDKKKKKTAENCAAK